MYGKETADSKLIRFAKFALQTMESDRDWSADTLTCIAEYAITSGLAEDDDCNYFTRTNIAKNNGES